MLPASAAPLLILQYASARMQALPCVCSITEIAAALAGLPDLQFVNLGYNLLDGQLDRACNLTSTKARARSMSVGVPECLTMTVEFQTNATMPPMHLWCGQDNKTACSQEAVQLAHTKSRCGAKTNLHWSSAPAYQGRAAGRLPRDHYKRLIGYAFDRVALKGVPRARRSWSSSRWSATPSTGPFRRASRPCPRWSSCTWRAPWPPLHAACRPCRSCRHREPGNWPLSETQ